MKCAFCGAEAETTYPDGEGDQTHVCGFCEQRLILRGNGEPPLYVTPGDVL